MEKVDFVLLAVLLVFLGILFGPLLFSLYQNWENKRAKKEFTGLAISAVLWLVVLEVLKRSVSGDTLEIIKAFLCVLWLAICSGTCVVALRTKAWGAH